MFIEYKDYPQLPIELMPEVFKSLRGRARYPASVYIAFRTWRATDVLQDWFNTTIKPLLPYQLDNKHPWDFLNVQQVIPGILIHKDGNRNKSLNYLIDPGGPDVVNGFYDDALNLLETYRIKPFMWHEFASNVNHGIEGITDKRLALSTKLQ